MNPKENSQAGATKLALIPAFSPEEKGNRRQTVGNVVGWNQVQGFNARIFRGILSGHSIGGCAELFNVHVYR
jgi:hypothetical protein